MARLSILPAESISRKRSKAAQEYTQGNTKRWTPTKTSCEILACAEICCSSKASYHSRWKLELHSQTRVALNIDRKEEIRRRYSLSLRRNVYRSYIATRRIRLIDLLHYEAVSRIRAILQQASEAAARGESAVEYADRRRELLAYATKRAVLAAIGV